MKILNGHPYLSGGLMVAGAVGAFWAIRALMRVRSRYDLRGKVVLITGGSRGLGLVLARNMAAKGARLVICARDEEQLGRAALELKSLGADVLTLMVDVRDPQQVREMVRTVIDQFGTVDVLVNNAGIIQVGPAEAMETADFKEAMDVNFWAGLYCMLECIPYFKAQGEGRIVNITSIGGKISVPHLLPYSASKFAAVGLSEGMHAALKKHNIVVTTVVPNLMQTGSARQVTVKGKHEAEYAMFKIAASSPLFSQKVQQAAESIVQALEYGEAEVILTAKAKLAITLKELAPGLFNNVLSLVDRLLPDQPPGVEGRQARKGYESESRLSAGMLAWRSDSAASENNEF